MLEIRGLHAFYGDAHILHGVSMVVAPGEAVALLGRNGMGKTTLCNAIMGMTPPLARGSIRFARTELVGRSSHKIANLGIGYVPQGRRLFPSLTVDEHLRMVASRNGGRRWTVDAVYELFPRLAERRKNGGAQLSGGEQQMLAIGRALMARPRLLLLDEPSLGLAPLLVRDIFRIIAQINRDHGTTILLVEQDAITALSIAHYGYVLETGRVVVANQAEALRNDEALRRSYLGY